MLFRFIKIEKGVERMPVSIEYCPACNREMILAKIEKETVFRGVNIHYKDNIYICPGCKLEIGTVGQTADLQKNISDAYRKETGLLTGQEIIHHRKRLNLTQKGLAKKIGIGIASVKRWEGGIIQSKSMDNLLRKELLGIEQHTDYTGNRTFSISRIKLVLKYTESLLNETFFKKGDRMLFAGKYLWYADFSCYRETKKSMTGSTYAALPYGPQLNNYSELLDPIKNADEKVTAPLLPEEKQLIERLVKAYPVPQKIYDASHTELIWKRRAIGEIIPYSDSIELQAF